MRISTFDREAEAQRAWVSSLRGRQQLLHVALLSGFGLFVELLLIRWLDGLVMPLAYAKNLPLIGSFLGLGIGFALARHSRSLLPAAVPLLALTLGVGVVASVLSLSGPRTIDANVPVPPADSTGEVIALYALIALVFALVVLATVPLGQIAGAFMEGLPALRAYTANLIGALAGIGLAFALSAWSLPPSLAAALAFAVLIGYLRSGSVLRILFALVAAGAVYSMIALDDRDGIVWSPYNKIAISQLPPVLTSDGPKPTGWVLYVQNIYYQRMLDLRATVSAEALRASPQFLVEAYYAYNLPYAFKKPHRVLVVGAGTGNDVAAALRHGAERVDAVEIDSVILGYGRLLHPERPYQDPRVHTIVADARAFLSGAEQRYDMIVFGLLDAQTSLFSSFANNIRLDNYVYTVEGLQQALAHLAPDGVLSLAFYVDRPWVGSRLGAMLQQAGGAPPLVAQVHYDLGYLYLAGPGLPRDVGRAGVAVPLSQSTVSEIPPGPLATDDWPFLYLRERRVAGPTLWSSLAVLAISLVLVRAFFRGHVRFDRHLFFLGAGFLLVETRTIAQLALLFGTTWRVSGITIGVILALAVLANLIVSLTGSLARPPLYGLLFVALGANFFVPPALGLGGNPLAAWAVACFFVLPLFFAALIFASSVRGQDDLAPVLASNLLGSVLGGVLESSSLVFGISSLSLVALALYGASFRR